MDCLWESVSSQICGSLTCWLFSNYFQSKVPYLSNLSTSSGEVGRGEANGVRLFCSKSFLIKQNLLLAKSIIDCKELTVLCFKNQMFACDHTLYISFLCLCMLRLAFAGILVALFTLSHLSC